MDRAPSVPCDGSLKRAPSVSSGACSMADVMVGRILSFVHSCKKLRAPVQSGKILFLWLYRLLVGRYKLLAGRYKLFVRAK